MLLIRCPYCHETLPEAEFTYAGQAHVVRAADPSSQSDEQWEEFLFIPRKRQGSAFRALAAPAWLWPLLQCGARHGERPFPDDLSRRRAAS
ncbi:hypothetical protein QE432_000468 [Agrobacterium sp. SORGH_AS 745]|nr:sarcosine oxidase subunit delta [Agrobacterium sp. SORGH_AS_0745]MDQ1218910.1 hypothetical protein [Agrobacterium sp. SORGH_AS_0745]